MLLKDADDIVNEYASESVNLSGLITAVLATGFITVVTAKDIEVYVGIY